MMKNLIDTWRAGQLIVLSGSSSSRAAAGQQPVDSFIGGCSHSLLLVCGVRACAGWSVEAGTTDASFPFGLVSLAGVRFSRGLSLSKPVLANRRVGFPRAMIDTMQTLTKTRARRVVSCRVVSCRDVSCRVVPF
jgi:hypothetical protein